MFPELKVNTDMLQSSRMTIWYIHVYSNGVLVFTTVGDDVCIGVPHAAVTADNFSRVENCILEDRHITVCETAAEYSLGFGCDEKLMNSLTS